MLWILAILRVEIAESVLLLHCLGFRYNFDLGLIYADTLICRCRATIGLVEGVEFCFSDDDEFHWWCNWYG